MTLNSQWSTAARNARLSADTTLCVSGFLDIYQGTQPANGDTALSGATRLVSLGLDSTPMSSPSSGTMSNADVLSATATATGTAQFAVLYESDHSTVIWMGSVGTSGCNINLATTAISSGVTVSIAIGGFVITDDASISGQ